MRAPLHRDLSALVDWYETLTPETLGRMGEFYAANAWFKDPFNDVTGLEAIRRVFALTHQVTATVLDRTSLADALKGRPPAPALPQQEVA